MPILFSICPGFLLNRDADNDGYYTGSGIVSCTSPGTGYKYAGVQPGDCNDNNSAVNPGAVEICSNAIDDNCNGQNDEGCTVQAIEEGHTINMFLAGDAVQLIRDGVLESLSGLGTGKLKDHFDIIINGGGKIFLSGMSAQGRV